MPKEQIALPIASERIPPVWSIATDASGRQLELWAIDLTSERARSLANQVLAPSDLVEARPATQPRADRRGTPVGFEICPAFDSLGCSVQRLDEEFGAIPGQISALRGLVILE